MRSNGENTLATQVPYKAAPNIEQLAGAPANFRRFLSEAVEKAPPIVQRALPIAFRHASRPVAIQSRPSVEIDSRNAISGNARALLDGLSIERPARPRCPKRPKCPRCPGCPAIEVSRRDTAKDCPIGTTQRVSSRLFIECPVRTPLRDVPWDSVRRLRASARTLTPRLR